MNDNSTIKTWINISWIQYLQIACPKKNTKMNMQTETKILFDIVHQQKPCCCITESLPINVQKELWNVLC